MNLEAFAVAVLTNTPVIMWGDPGVGKSSLIEKGLAPALNIYCETVIASIREPSDFGGYPVAGEGRLQFLPAPFIYRVLEMNDAVGTYEDLGGRRKEFVPTLDAEGIIQREEKPIGSILNLDELSTAPPAVQAACLRLVLDRYAGDTRLPDNCAVVAAANPPEIAAGGWEMSPPLSNRFIHLDASPDLKKFQAGMLSGWPTPNVRPLNAEWKKGLPAANGLTTAFLQSAQHRFNNPPKGDSEDNVLAYPSPRTWEYAGTILAACKDYASETTLIELLTGTVGAGPAAEFIEWRERLDLPDPEALLKNPKKLRLPDRSDQAYAILTSVVAAILADNTPERWSKGWDVLAVAIDQNMPDVAAVAATTLGTNQPEGEVRAPKSAAKFSPLILKAGLV